MPASSCGAASRPRARARWRSASRSPTTTRASAPSPSWRARSSCSVSPVWLTHLVASEGGAAAERRAEALGADVHAELVATADRLAVSSAVLAQRCYAQAPGVWQSFGPAGFRRWFAIGDELATGTPRSIEGALAYFAVAPAAIGPGGLAGAAAWCDLARQLATRSPRLAATFLEQT